jgi:hypothetical protein
MLLHNIFSSKYPEFNKLNLVISQSQLKLEVNQWRTGMILGTTLVDTTEVMMLRTIAIDPINLSFCNYRYVE